MCLKRLCPYLLVFSFFFFHFVQGQTVNDSAPVILSYSSSNSGPSTGGTTVTLRGENFTGITAVFFGTNAGTNLTVESDTFLRVVSPPSSSQTDNLTVLLSLRKGSITYTTPFPFLYTASTITGFTPNTIAENGTLTIYGTNFGTDQNRKVVGVNLVSGGSNGTYAAKNLSILSDTELTVTISGIPNGISDGIDTYYQVQLVLDNTAVIQDEFDFLLVARNSSNLISAPTNLVAISLAGLVPRPTKSEVLLSFRAPNSTNRPVVFNIYSDPTLRDLLAVLPYKKRVLFIDKRKSKPSGSYYITAEDAYGNTTNPVQVTIHTLSSLFL